MKSLIIRKIPDDLHRALKIKAAQEGKSIQAKIIELIRKETNSEKKS